MAAMRPLKAFTLWSISPVLLSAACRVSPLIPDRTSSQQCSAYSTSTADPITFKIAASFSAKGARFDTKKDIYSYNPPASAELLLARLAGKKQRRPNSGQDAFFVAPVGDSNDVAFGVADGVGGWMDSGVDPADFSHGLCARMRDAAARVEVGKERELKPGQLLQKGYDDIVEDDSIPAGGSTACIAIGRSDGILEVAK